MLTANGGTTGTGGLVALTSTGTTDLAISGNGSVIEALGGTTSGNGGTVNITTSAALTIGAGTKVLTTAVSGIGGPITLSATSSIYGAISISGAVHADGSTGGKVVVTAGNQAAFSDLTFATGAFLTADSTGSGTTGSVTVSTATANELDITGAGTLSALNGTVTLSQPGQNVVVNVGSLIGNIVSTANSISLTDSSNTTPFTLKQLNATMSSITLTKTGSGNIVSSGSSETVQAIGTSNTTGSLSVTMNQGYFGVAGVPILTQVESTSFNTSGASANVVIQNTDAGKSDGSTITGSVGGSLTYTTSGLLQVLLQAELSAGGNITLQGGKINLENLSDVTAKGNVAFSIGRAAQASCSQINIMPPCATPLHTMPTITSPGNIYWGTNGISANGGTITVVANGQTITFDSNGPAGNIFGGASTIHAGN